MSLDSDVSYVSLDCDGFSKKVYEKIRCGGKRDVFFKNVKYFLQRRKERNQKTPIIDVKIIEMPENQYEVEQVMKYWQSKGSWTAKRRQYSWGGDNKNSKLENKDFRIVCGKSLEVCAITWDGKIFNCTADTVGIVIWGDLNSESLQDIWKRRNDWQIVDEECFDEHGTPINKNYKSQGKVFAEKG